MQDTIPACTTYDTIIKRTVLHCHIILYPAIPYHGRQHLTLPRGIPWVPIGLTFPDSIRDCSSEGGRRSYGLIHTNISCQQPMKNQKLASEIPNYGSQWAYRHKAFIFQVIRARLWGLVRILLLTFTLVLKIWMQVVKCSKVGRYEHLSKYF